MKISVKGSYGLSAMIYLGINNPNKLSSTFISGKLGISKIYLEQVLSLLKRANLINSEKGANGGYVLAKPMDQITSLDILYAIETNLFAVTEVTSSINSIEKAMEDLVFKPINDNLYDYLKTITLVDLVNKSVHSSNDINMYYI